MTPDLANSGIRHHMLIYSRTDHNAYGIQEEPRSHRMWWLLCEGSWLIHKFVCLNGQSPSIPQRMSGGSLVVCRVSMYELNLDHRRPTTRGPHCLWV